MTDEKKPGSTETTMQGLPEVASGATQVMESAVPTLEPLPPVAARSLDQVTAPVLPPVDSPAPPRAKTGSEVPRAKTGSEVPRARTGSEVPRAKTGSEIPRTKTAGTIPRADPPRRPSRIADAQSEGTDPARPIVPEPEPFEWTLPRAGGLAGVISLLFILLWVFWPSSKATQPRPTEPEPVAIDLPIPVPLPSAKPVAPVAPLIAPSTRPTLSLDARKHVIDPFAAHLPDLELDPAHKYRLRVERDDSRLGTALARLDEKKGWGVMRKMASHAVLQFGGAKALRLHCEPGSHFHDGQTLPLELLDLATKQKVPVPVNPALHCWDFEMTRVLELGEGVKKRVRVPTDSTVKVGDKVSVRVAWVLESLGEKKEWRTGVMGPGESVLAEGRMARFALLDPYAGDNEGTLDLEVLPGDTQNSGLVTPSASGAQFVK